MYNFSNGGSKKKSKRKSKRKSKKVKHYVKKKKTKRGSKLNFNSIKDNNTKKYVEDNFIVNLLEKLKDNNPKDYRRLKKKFNKAVRQKNGKYDQRIIRKLVEKIKKLNNGNLVPNITRLNSVRVEHGDSLLLKLGKIISFYLLTTIQL